MIARILQDEHLFPKVIVCLYICASIRYGYGRDYGRSLYWFSAMMITVSVTFLKFKS